MASTSTAFTLKDAGFFVRNVPLTFGEWELFNVFSKFGLVAYCRIGGSAAEKTSQFGFINMISVHDADNVRKALKDGVLAGNGYNLQVVEVQNDGQRNAPIKQQVISKAAAKVKIPSAWLPLGEQFAVKVVELLPCSSVAEDVFLLTIRKINDGLHDTRYQLLNEKMAAFNQLTKFEGEVEIGYDCLYKSSLRSAFRARRISTNQLYLIDVGEIVAYDKTKCFVIPKPFTMMPMNVSTCTIDGLKWSQAAIPTFDKIRDVVKQWGQLEREDLQAVVLGYSGSLNLINLHCKQAVLAERLQRKGFCEYIPRDSKAANSYSREYLMKLRNVNVKPKIVDNDVLQDLARNMDGISIN